MREYLANDRVLYGATILDKGVKHTFLGKFLMFFLNSVGIFGNWGEEEEGYEGVLKENFEEVEVRVLGVVLLITARGPRKDIGVKGGRRAA
jgi:hypothetical protein